MITMAGLVPGSDIRIVFTGLRPGEKLTEELMTEEEERSQVVRNRIYAAQSPPPPSDLQEQLARLRYQAETSDRAGLLRSLKGLVPTYIAAEQSGDAPAVPDLKWAPAPSLLRH